MPVNPANQGFPQGGPNAVSPQVIYDQSQKAPYGFLTSTVPGLMNLANLAGGIQKMIEGDPAEEAKAKYYESAGKVEESKSKLAQEAQYVGLAEGIRKLPANQRTAAAEALKNVVPPEFHPLLDASTTMGNQEQSAAYAIGYGASPTSSSPVTWQQVVSQQTTRRSMPAEPGAKAGIGSDVYSAPGGKGAPEAAAPPQQKPVAPGAPQPPEKKGEMPFAGVDPYGAPQPPEKKGEMPFAGVDPYGAPTLASLMGRGKTPEGESPTPNQVMGPAGEQVARLEAYRPAISQGAVGPLVDQGPAPAPYIQTNFGQVPTPQRQLLPPEAALNSPGSVRPNDVLPLAEAHANPAFNQAVDMVYQNATQPVMDHLRALSASRVFGYLERGEAVPVEDMIMANMDAYAANQYLQSHYQKVGVLPKEAGDFESIMKLALYMKTMGKDWNEEKYGNLHSFLQQYTENPALLRAVYPIAKDLVEKDIQLQQSLSSLEEAKIRAAATMYSADQSKAGRIYAANMGYKGRMGAAEIEAGWQQGRNEIMAFVENNKMLNAVSARTRDEIKTLSQGIQEDDARIATLLRQVGGSNLPTGYKEKVANATTWLRYLETVESTKIKLVQELNEVQKQISLHQNYIESNPEEAGIGGDGPSPRMLEMSKNKRDLEARAKDLTQRISSYDLIMNGGVDKDGKKTPGIRDKVNEVFLRLGQDPASSGARNNPKDPQSAEILSIESELNNIRQERAAKVDLRELLRNPTALQGALSRQASTWVGNPPSYEEFANSPFPGTNTPIGMHIPEPTLRQYYGFFVGQVAAYQRDAKVGRDALAGNAADYLDQWTKNPGKVFQIGADDWPKGGIPSELGKYIQYLLREGYVAVKGNKDGSWQVRLTPKGQAWVKKKPRISRPAPEAKPGGYVQPYTELTLPPGEGYGIPTGDEEDGIDPGLWEDSALEGE